VISCGGDGTFVWVLQEVINSKVDLKYIHFGVLPFGTGNDLA